MGDMTSPDAGQQGGAPQYPNGPEYPAAPQYPGAPQHPYDQSAPMPQWATSGDMYGAPQSRGPNGMAIAGLVLGVIGIFILNIVLGPLAVIFGALGLNRARRGASGRGMAIAGIALGIFDVVIWVIVLIAVSRSGYTI